MIIPNLVTDDNYHQNKTTALKVCLSLLDSLHLQAYNYTDQSVQLWRDHNGKDKQKRLNYEDCETTICGKGYDATGMEEIASNAGVPKSLIYYHFKSKEDLLNAVITEFVDEYKDILHDSRAEGIEKISVYMEFLKQNRDCARILMSESLKSGSSQTILYQVLAPLMEIDGEQSSDNPKMDHAHWLTEFFTSILPSILFVCYEDSWCDYFGISAGQMEEEYFTAYRLTHGAYHEHIHKVSK